jgi:protein-S-isoprenylcysteine O-methyltransferase Ste14
MTSREVATFRGADGGDHWPATVASLAVGCAFFALWFWLLPSWLGFHVETAGRAAWRWMAAVPSVLGFALAFRCVWDFGRTGHGTPAFYRYVRNPMYLGFISGWVGLWVIFGRANMAALIVVSAVVLFVVSFVLLYEEPTLRKTFGAEYEEYCRNVRRWVPHLRPWRLQ